MDQLIIDINEKLPKNCIHKIALIASVYAGKNNFCHHLIIAEKLRLLISKSNSVNTYGVYKIFGTKFNNRKHVCKKILDINYKLYHLLINDLRNNLCNSQYADNAYVTKSFTIENELYYPLHNNLKNCKFRGKFMIYEGYFKKDSNYFDKKNNNKGQFTSDDICNFKMFYDEIKLFLLLPLRY